MNAAPWKIPVSEFMSRALVSVRPATAIDAVWKILERRDISAVPVIDRDGGLRGILSTTDILRAAHVETVAPAGRVRIAASVLEARDVMQPLVVTVDEDAPLRDAAEKMIEHRIHRVVVLRSGRPTGVLSTRDAMRAVLFHRVSTPLSRVMTAPVDTIDQNDTVDVAIHRLQRAQFRGLVVVEGEWPIGVFTRAEAIRARALGPAALETPVERMMSHETICLDVSTPLCRVAGYAIEMRVRRILAVDQRRLRGIVTGFDLARVMTESFQSSANGALRELPN